MIDEAQLRHVARLARLDLTGQDLERLRGELGRVLELMQVLERVDTGAHEPVTAPEMALRPDVLAPSLPVAEVLAHAPASSPDGGFAVPRVLA